MATKQAEYSKAFRIRAKMNEGKPVTDDEKDFLATYEAGKKKPGRPRAEAESEPATAKEDTRQTLIGAVLASVKTVADSEPAKEPDPAPSGNGSSEPAPVQMDGGTGADPGDSARPSEGPSPGPTLVEPPPPADPNAAKAPPKDDGKKEPVTGKVINLSDLAGSVAGAYGEWVKETQREMWDGRFNVAGFRIPKITDEIVDMLIVPAATIIAEDYIKSKLGTVDPVKSAKIVAAAPAVEYGAFLFQGYWKERKDRKAREASERETRQATRPAPVEPAPAPAAAPVPEPARPAGSGVAIVRRAPLSSFAPAAKASDIRRG